jgi:anhydro-N-acetylmuramic acid kinase
MELGFFFGRTTLEFLKSGGFKPGDVSVIGSHGHTVCHGGNERPAHTLQIGEPCVIAELTGLPVAADFRMRDVAAGGQGAPLVPFFDEFFFRGPKTRALQNIGGIANVSFVGPHPTLAFDNGPGNCLIDWAAGEATRGRWKFDRDGRLAARGRIDFRAVREMAAHGYFRKKPPKSTGRELFNPAFIPRRLRRSNPRDLAATLTYFTAFAIRQSCRFAPAEPAEVIVSGGGALNPVLMRHLKELLAPAEVRSVEELGIPALAKEPLAFAFFAIRALEGEINHLPEATGARGPRLLGKLIPAGPHDALSGLKTAEAGRELAAARWSRAVRPAGRQPLLPLFDLSRVDG